MLDRAATVFARLRTESFPARSRAVVARQTARLRVRPMVFLPVADRRSFPRYYVSGLEHGILRVPGHTQLGLGQPVDCGISFGREGVILQAPGRVVSKCLVPAPGRSLGVDVELSATEPHTRSLIESFLAAGSLPQAARHSWRYHADIDVEYPADGIAQLDALEDISLDGAAIRGPHPPQPGARVPLRLIAPAGPPIELMGEVRWRRPGADPAFGVRFEFPSPGDRTRMLELIGALRSAIVDSPAGMAAVH
jgi:Tfp pilus assembly protein PilZ